MHLYFGTEQIVVKNSNILPRNPCSSQRLHIDDSEQKMYLIECLALDHGRAEVTVSGAGTMFLAFHSRAGSSNFVLVGISPLFFSKADPPGIGDRHAIMDGVNESIFEIVNNISF